MFTKIKLLSIASLFFALSSQITMFAMVHKETPESIYHKYITSDAYRQYVKEQSKKKPHPWNIFVSLQKKYAPKDKNAKTAIKKELLDKLTILKERDNNDLFITEDEISELKKLWDKLKSLYNYNWIDGTTYPLHKLINPDKLIKIRNSRPLCFFIHSDKYSLAENKAKIESLFTYLDDFSRVKKPFDFIIDPIVYTCTALSTKAAFQIGAQIVSTTSSLPSILMPDYFKNKEVLMLEKATKNETITAQLYGTAVKREQNTLQQYDTALKKIELSANKKQLKIRQMLHKLDLQNQQFSN